MSLRYGLVLAAAAASLAAGDAGAQTAPFLDGAFTIDIYNGDGGGSAGSDGVQALLTNPLITGEPLDTVTYTGPLNFGLNLGQDVPSTIGDFFASGSGETQGLDEETAFTNLSSPPFADTTVLVITFTKTAIPDGSIDHDDGIGLYLNSALETPEAASAPTTVATTPFGTEAGGTYQLVYVAANGNPSILRVRGTPVEPQPDFVDFACRIDLAQTAVAAPFNVALPATASEKFCPEDNGGLLKLNCSGTIPDYPEFPPIVSTSSVVCRISGAQCGLPGEFEAPIRSISIDSSGFAELTCEANVSQ